VIAAMCVLAARRALLFYVSNFAVRGHFTVTAGDAAAAERREAEKSNETHHDDPLLTLSNSCTAQLEFGAVTRASSAHPQVAKNPAFSSLTILKVRPSAREIPHACQKHHDD
jgi:hypothetical protein